MKRRTWLAALVALCMLALPAALASEADAGEIVADFSGEAATEIYEDIDAEPVDEIGAEAVEQEIDAVAMDLDDDDTQSALLAEYSVVEADAVPDGEESDTGEVPAPDDAPTGDESDAGETPAPDKDESDAGEVVAADDNSAAEEPAPPADPIIASLEPVAEQVSTAAMFGSTAGTITDDCIGKIDSVIYNGNPQTPEVVVTVNGEELKLNTDYNVAYTNNVDAGEATVTVTGKGNYTGEANGSFIIAQATIDDAMVTCDSNTYSYTGEPIMPNLSVALNNHILVKNTDYEVSYSNGHTNVGEVTIIVTGKGNYTGETKGFFTISPASINTATVTCQPISSEYDGTAKEPGVTVTLNSKPLNPNVDYGNVTYSNNTNKGTATVTVTGTGNYTGTATGNFTINPASIKGAAVTCDAQTYDGTAKTPGVTVKIGNTTLSKDDYEIIGYENNVNAGTNATVKIKGRGNYTDEATGTFTINKADRVIEVKLKSGKTITKVYDKTRNLKVTESDFEFSPNKQLPTDTLSFASITGGYPNADVGDHDISITFTISQEGRNYNYKLKNNGVFTFKGSITPIKLTVRPGVKKKDANGNVVHDANGKVVLETQTKVYGTANPSTYSGVFDGTFQGDTVKVTGKLTREEGENVGKYKIKLGNVTITGNKNYEDNPPNLEDAYFEIKPKPINDKDIGIGSIGNQQYTGSAITPDGEIKLRYGTKTLTKGTDYTLSYSNNVGPGTATVTITGKGNYKGSRTATFRILKAATTTTSNSSSSSSGSSNVTEDFPIVTNGKYVVSTNQTIRLNLGNLSARSFKSSNKKVASVDRNGIVTTKKAGKAKITITLGKKTKIKLKLTVIDPTIPTSVSLAPVNTAVKKGDVVTLTPGVPENANPGGYKWKSSNKKVATVKNGVVTFKKPGKVTITCTAKRGKKKARVKFRVSK